MTYLFDEGRNDFVLGILRKFTYLFIYIRLNDGDAVGLAVGLPSCIANCVMRPSFGLYITHLSLIHI